MNDSSKAELAPTHSCSFCGKNNIEVKGALIAVPGVCICQKCVFGCVKIIFESNEKSGGGIETR